MMPISSTDKEKESQQLTPDVTVHDSAAQHWQQTTERGSSWGLSILLWVLRVFGRPVLGIVLYPVLAYFFVTGKTARTASREYLHRLAIWHDASLSHRVSWRLCFNHFMDFAWTVADKIDAWSGNITHQHVDVMNPDTLHELLADPRGALIIGAHMGNHDVLRAVYQTEGSPYYQDPNARQHQVNVIMHTDHMPMLHRMMIKLSKHFNTNIFQVRDIGPETALAWRQCVEQGDWLCILGDRTTESNPENTVSVDFLGHTARWPTGPWILAHILECPVYLFLCVKTRTRFGRPYYRLYIERIAEQITLPRKTRQASLQNYVAQYVRRLEKQCQETPTQWFNFYPFWKQ